MDHLHDVRPSDAFRLATFSGHQRTAVKKAFLTSLVRGEIESSCHWSCELVCSGHLSDLWEIIVLFFSKHIHAANPKLILYLELRLNTFKQLVADKTDLDLRNDPIARKMFAEIVCVLCSSPKRQAFDEVKVPQADFNLTQVHTKLRAPRGDIAKLLSADPPELTVPFNELAHAVHSKRGLEACYWLEWVLEFERLCVKKKHPCATAPRSYMPGRTDVVWIFWDIVCSFLSSNPALSKVALATLNVFKVQYKNPIKDSKRFLLYFAIALCCDSVDLSVELVHDKLGIEALCAKCHLFYRDRAKHCVN